MRNAHNKLRRGRKGLLCMVLGLLLIAAAAGLTAYNLWDSARAGEASQSALTVLRQEIPPQTQPEQEIAVESLPDIFFENEPVAVPEMPTVKVNGYDYIGTLDIPTLGISLPIMSTWSYDHLKYAPCVFSGSWYTDDMIIAGHNYTTHFSPLKYAPIGTKVIFTAVDGTVLTYQVDNIETISGYSLGKMLEHEGWDLTLFTCTTSGEARYTLRCVKIQ